MKAIYLIKLIEDYCTEKKLNISKFYETLAEKYQDEYGVNIILEMQSTGEWDITKYLEGRTIVERYVSILNNIKKELCLNY